MFGEILSAQLHTSLSIPLEERIENQNKGTLKAGKFKTKFLLNAQVGVFCDPRVRPGTGGYANTRRLLRDDKNSIALSNR